MQKKRNYRKPIPKGKEQDQDRRRTSNAVAAEKSGKANDPKWYTTSDQMVKDVGSISFNNALGTPFQLRNEDGNSAFAPSFNYGAVPGIMSIYTVPACGYAGSETDGINIASKNNYSWLRYYNSGAKNYDSPDAMLYYLSMDSIYSLFAFLMRVYGTARVYSQRNKYVGYSLLRAMGVDPEDVVANLSNLRSYINIFITKAQTMCIPATMTYYLRHMWMYNFIYRDEDIDKSSFYMYVPAGFWKLDATGATALKFEPFMCDFSTTTGLTRSASLKTVNYLIYYAENLLNPIIANEDFNIISGDTLKAYGKENLFSLELIKEDFASIPVYSDEVLYQIHNTQFAGNVPLDLNYNISLDSLGIIQDTSIGSGNLLYMPKFERNPALALSRIIDFYKQDVTPEDVIVATRNMLVGNNITVEGQSAPSVCTIESCGSEICLFATIWRIDYSGTFTATGDYFTHGYVGTVDRATNLQKFNFSPIAVYGNVNAASSTFIPTGIVGDLGNYTILSREEVKKMHDTAILSMFGVPNLGNAIR